MQKFFFFLVLFFICYVERSFAQGGDKPRVTQVDETPERNLIYRYIKQEKQEDSQDQRHVLTYDALERVEHSVKYNALGVKLSETHSYYDVDGNKILEIHEVLVEGCCSHLWTIQWSYDTCQRVTSITEGEGTHSKTTRYHYNTSGQLDQMIKPDGTLLLYTYNDEGQLEHFEASDHSFAYRYCYDDLQRLVTIHDLCHDLVQTRQYNDFDELIEEELTPGVKVSHQYDEKGRRMGLTLPDASRILYHYQGSLLTSVERLGADAKTRYTHSYVYDKKQQLQSCHLLNALGSVDYHYDDQGKPVAVQSPWLSQKIEEKESDCYQRLLTLSVQDPLGKSSSHFTYTEEGQLASEEGHQYTYDSLFNRLSDNGQSWKVNSLNQLVQTPAGSYDYDPNGNLITKHLENAEVHYSYDARDRLIRVEYPEEQAFTYVYDAFDRRIEQREWKWEDQQKSWQLYKLERLIYDGFKDIGTLNQQGQCTALRVLGQGQGAEIGAAVAIELQGKVLVPLHDLLGSVRCLVDPNTREVVESYRYSAYGQESLWDGKGHALVDSQIGNPWRFLSKRVDEQTSLVFFGKRYYDAGLGRWMTPDPLFFCDTPNLYSFARNDPMNCYDLHGLFSVSQAWSNVLSSFFAGFHYLQVSAHQARLKWGAELKLPSPAGQALERIGKTLFGESIYLLMGTHFQETYADCYGQHEISDKVRVTFINGILNTRQMMLQALDLISESHGGVKVHYVFRPSEGWMWDISRAIMIKAAFVAGFRSLHAHLLAKMWRELIYEMGGVEGGGSILHYAHSLGGTETDRARDLLSPEEQKMIRVVTFGSPTLIQNGGFKNVYNVVSVNDGVSSFLLDPIGNTRNFFCTDSNVGSCNTLNFKFFITPDYWPTDHFLNGPSYGPIVREFGEHFLKEFNPK